MASGELYQAFGLEVGVERAALLFRHKWGYPPQETRRMGSAIMAGPVGETRAQPCQDNDVWARLAEIAGRLDDSDIALLVGAVMTFMLTERPRNLAHFRHWLAWRAQIEG